ncbi:MAG TPA: dehydrogenase E1 component subunit alpha/beta [Bacteroidia bacterium]|nr:dehydrogenase E1 component subunit alpha/beta [Bacteroidia bacterium]
MIATERAITYNRKLHDDNSLIELYKGLLLPRVIEEKMLSLLRQGKVSKWFSGIGQEAISVGAAMALDKESYILPMHRNLGVFTSRHVPLDRLFKQFQGKAGGFTKGRDRSFHFGTNEYKIVGMISHLGPQMGVADGIALGDMLRKQKGINPTIVFSGDGGSSEGDFHESINVAAVWDLPVIFIIENNGYGLSTPSSEQFRCKQFIDKAIGYGIEGVRIDGNNILEVYDTIKELSKKIQQKSRPFILECVTFRMRGHEEASGTKYVPQELFDMWGKKDPVTNYETYLLEQGVLTPAVIEEIRAGFKNEIEKALESAMAEQPVKADAEREFADVYKPYQFQLTSPGSSEKKAKRYIDAVSEGLKLAMKKHSNLILMGQDIGEYGGVFKVTEGFIQEFGKERVRNTPLCESAIIGAGFGLSINGYKAMVEMQFADFVTCGFNQIINNLAKSHYRWGQNADVVVRLPTGAGTGAGPFHSQSNEAWFTHTPGLKVVYPAFPSDAKGLLLASFEDPNPVIYFEHKALYRSITEDVYDDYYTVEIGKARRIVEGNDVSIITYGYGVHWAMEALKNMPDISADLIDLRTLLPLDTETIYESVKKTGKVIILHEDTYTGGIGGELSALISEHCFEYLDAPVIRSASFDTPIPMGNELEWDFLPKSRFVEQLKQVIAY